MELEERIRVSKDFEQIRYAHDTFLTKIQSQSFLINKIVSILICLILFSNNLKISFMIIINFFLF